MTATLDDEVADLRRANAELQQRLDEALAREAATAEVLGVINSSPGDLAPVFDAMLEKAVKLCAASFGLLMRYDGDLLNAVAHYNSPPQFVEFLRTPVRPASGMASYRILRGEDVVTFADVAADPSYSAESEAARRLVELSGARSHLTAALRRDGVLLGVIVIYRQEVLPFTEREIALVKNFAAQAVIAMENARLLTETREALAQQTATAEVLQVINSSPGDLTPVFNAMLEKAMRLCGAAFGFMTVIDGEQSRTVAARGVPAAYAAFRERNPTPANAPISSRVRKGEPFIRPSQHICREILVSRHSLNWAEPGAMSPSHYVRTTDYSVRSLHIARMSGLSPAARSCPAVAPARRPVPRARRAFGRCWTTCASTTLREAHACRKLSRRDFRERLAWIAAQGDGGLLAGDEDLRQELETLRAQVAALQARLDARWIL